MIFDSLTQCREESMPLVKVFIGGDSATEVSRKPNLGSQAIKTYSGVKTQASFWGAQEIP